MTAGNAEEDRPVVAMSGALAENPTLAALLDRPIRSFRKTSPSKASLLVGWGYRPSGKRALDAGVSHDVPVNLLEDGFLRSVGRRDMALSINFDTTGIYYDSSSPSRLFELIRRPLSEEQRDRARAVQMRWVEQGLSKYNDAREGTVTLPERFALVIDQVRNDLSISSGQADEQSFRAMLEDALASDPDRDVVVKIHPDSLSDPSKRHFDPEALSANDRVHVVAEPVHIAGILARAEEIFTVTSQVGFEALIHGKPVTVYGMPFYAGWGLTRDALDRPEGRSDVDLAQLIHAALIDYPRYYHPVRQEEVEPESVMELVGLNRALRGALPREIHALGFSSWKRPFIRDFLSGSTVHFVREVAHVPAGSTLLLWGRREVPEKRDDVTVLRIEDGFMRSSGLGANLVRPLSLVLDDRGIYYDATTPSRLESLLQDGERDDADRARAAALRRSILAAGVNKYNLGGRGWQRPETGGDVILVVGQVEQDASIRYGSPKVKTNRALLETVRKEHPDAHILYKPHPDVLAGLRERGSDPDAGDVFYDELVGDVDPNALLEKVDRVHTMTSQMGFEALMHGTPVTCHGIPFYAGWGLTDDRLDCARRTRRLTIDDLCHAALIAYPRYFSPRANLFASPEDILVELADLAARGPAKRPLLRRLLYWGVTRWVKRRPR